MRKRLAMCALFAGIAMGIGAWVACDNGMSAATVPARAVPAPVLPAGAPEASAGAAGAGQLHALSTGGPVTPEVLHHGNHRVWLEWAAPGSAEQLCEGDAVPAAVLRRDDAQGNIYAMVYVADPEHEGGAADAETRHVGEHLPSGEDIDFVAGETSVPLSYLGTIHHCVGCGDVRDLTVGIASVHDRDDGSDHAGTYGIGTELTFVVHKSTHSVCAGGEQ